MQNYKKLRKADTIILLAPLRQVRLVCFGDFCLPA